MAEDEFLLQPDDDLGVGDPGLAGISLVGDEEGAANLIPLARILLESRKTTMVDRDIRVLDEVIELDDNGTLIRIQTLDDVDRLTIVVPVEPVEPVEEVEQLQLVLSLENGHIDMDQAWRDVRANVPVEDQRPGWLFWPIGLQRLLEPYGGLEAPNDTKIRVRGNTLWHDRTYLVDNAYSGEFRANSNPPIASIPFAPPINGARLVSNRWIDPATWYMQMAGVGKFRRLTEAAFGKPTGFEWQQFCRVPTIERTWGLYTLLRYPDEADTYPASLRYWLVSLATNTGADHSLQFWELPIAGVFSPVVERFMALGRETEQDSYDLKHERRRIEAHILAQLKPPVIFGSEPDEPDFEIPAEDFIVQGRPIFYGFQMSPMGERIAVATRDPVYRASGSPHASPGIDYWTHRLYRGDLELDEEALYDATDPRIEFLFDWREEVVIDVAPARFETTVYVPSFSQPGQHVWVRWDTQGKQDDYEASGAAVIQNRFDCPFHVYYKDDGREVLVNYDRDNDPSVPPDPTPQFWNSQWAAMRARITHERLFDGDTVGATDSYIAAFGRDLSGFTVWEEQTAGALDHELIADYRWDKQLSTDNNGRNRLYRLIKISKATGNAPIIENADDVVSLWRDGDTDPNADPCNESLIPLRGWSNEIVEPPREGGVPSTAPTIQEADYATVDALDFDTRSGEDPNSLLIFPSYCSEGAILGTFMKFDDLVLAYRTRRRRACIRIIDNQEDPPNVPTNTFNGWSPDGSLANWRITPSGSTFDLTIQYLPNGTELYRQTTWLDLHNQHDPMRIAERNFTIAPEGTDPATPGIDRVVQPGETLTEVIQEMSGQWDILLDMASSGGDPYYIPSFIARLGCGGYGWLTSDFANDDPALKQSTRGGMPAESHGDYTEAGGLLWDKDDSDPPETDPAIPELPILPPENIDNYFDMPGPDFSDNGIGCGT